jgi:hypothetical protein
MNWPITGAESYVRETGKSMKAGELAAPQKQRVAIGWWPLLTLVFQARTHQWDA